MVCFTEIISTQNIILLVYLSHIFEHSRSPPCLKKINITCRISNVLQQEMVNVIILFLISVFQLITNFFYPSIFVIHLLSICLLLITAFFYSSTLFWFIEMFVYLQVLKKQQFSLFHFNTKCL